MNKYLVMGFTASGALANSKLVKTNNEDSLGTYLDDMLNSEDVESVGYAPVSDLQSSID